MGLMDMQEGEGLLWLLEVFKGDEVLRANVWQVQNQCTHSSAFT
jgi:hypothetical protein